MNEKCHIDGVFAYKDDIIVANNYFKEAVQKFNIVFNVL